MAILRKLQPSARAIILDSAKEKILLVKRKDLPVWELPGGGIEEGETPEESVLREVFEETGLKANITRPVGIYYPLCRLASVSYTFECTPYEGDMRLSDETTDIRFFPLNKLPKYLPPPYPHWINDALENNSDCLVKPISSVTYKALLAYLIKYPKLVTIFLLSRMKKSY
ncbi:NUDIX hydrolase [Candidatus Aerophobetes bacterium]|uniref:NUDIX hydrolase n=1 Tax=Aerophobetes bacterium TaxID=2030807 RepID=A0A2A4X6R3_UNCAE|nr:MAG: NUDIX hydrolase [Candidatus Aerophobetes bacterium]